MVRRARRYFGRKRRRTLGLNGVIMIDKTILQILEVFYQLYLWFFNLFFGSVAFIYYAEVIRCVFFGKEFGGDRRK